MKNYLNNICDTRPETRRRCTRWKKRENDRSVCARLHAGYSVVHHLLFHHGAREHRWHDLRFLERLEKKNDNNKKFVTRVMITTQYCIMSVYYYYCNYCFCRDDYIRA